MFKNKKGQAAMEYLMTYGWALLVIVIVLALLLIILGGYLQGTPSCMFEEAGFICNDPVTPVIGGAANNMIYGQFQHAQNEPIIIHRTTFVIGQISKDSIPSDCWFLGESASRSVSVAPREPVTFGDIASLSFPADPDGLLVCNPNTPQLGAPQTPGSQVRGQLWIEYNYASDDQIGFPGRRTAVATVIANVE